MSSGVGSGRGVTADDVVHFVKHYYAQATLILLIVFMLYIRLRPIDRFTDNDPVQWQAVDPYYHWRATEWSVRNFPFTMPFDPFTGFPTGRYVGQFGTLFDQFIALIALIIGLGSPDQSQIVLAGLIGVPIIAAAVAIPVFYIGRRLAGTLPALAGVAVLALAPGEFLTRSMTGMFQHHAAEVLMMAISILAMMVAIRIAEREQPVWELVLDRDWEALKRPAMYSAAAGTAIAVYAWVWPPAVVIVGILGVYFVVAIALDHVRGVSPEPVAFVGAVSFGTTAILTLLLAEVYAFDGITAMDLFVPFAAAAVVLGCVALGWLSRVWFARDLSPVSYPVAVGSAGLVALAVMWLLLPDIYSFFMGNLTSRVLPIDPGVGAQTIAEARPPDDPGDFFFEQFGLAFYSMIVGLAALAARPFIGKSYRREHTLIIVWSLFLVSMALTQIRFSYYLVLAVAVANAYLVGVIIDFVDLPRIENFRQIQGYQVLTLVLVAMLLFVPLLPPVAATSAWDATDRAHPSNDGVVWAESTQFLKDNTPAVGDWGGADNADDLDFWGSYSNPGNGFDYPDGAYGVMSWWDYGHLITSHGERIPHSNPFQQNARSSAHYLLAPNETVANMHLDAIEATGDGVSTNDYHELREILDDYDGELTNDIRYVMVEDQMLGGKFGAKTEWTGEGIDDYLDSDLFQYQDSNETLTTWGDTYYETMMAQLYRGDGLNLDHYRLVHESADEFSLVGFIDLGGNLFQSLRLNTQLGQDIEDFQDVAAMDQLLTAAAQNNQVIDPFLALGIPSGIAAWDTSVEPAVKTFERVEGATITGTADNASATIVAEVEVTTNANRTFTYRNVVEPDEDGSFEITVPYATDYDLSVDDGYTEPAVETADNVVISEVMGLDDETLANADRHGDPIEDHGANVTRQGHVSVSETDVYEGNQLTVELTEPPAFEITRFDTPDGNVTVNETFEIEIELTNTGGLAGETWFTLSDAEGVFVQEEYHLEPGESINLTFEHAVTNETHEQLTAQTPDTMLIRFISVVPEDNSTTEWIPPLARVGG